MKRLMVLLAAALAGVSIYAVAAPAGQQAVTPRQFAALQKRVTTLEKNLKVVRDTTNAIGACLVTAATAVPIAVFGTADEGYVYRLTSGQLVVTTGMDVLSSSEVTDQTPHMIVTTRACASAINGARILPKANRPAQRLRLQLRRQK